jgi:hypothetical protein
VIRDYAIVFPDAEERPMTEHIIANFIMPGILSANETLCKVMMRAFLAKCETLEDTSPEFRVSDGPKGEF